MEIRKCHREGCESTPELKSKQETIFDPYGGGSIAFVDGHYTVYTVECECGLRVGDYTNKDHAVEAWNG